MNELQYRFKAKLWVYSGQGAWHFITLPIEHAEEIKMLAGATPGFGSVKVRAEVASIVWETSIFPDKKSSSYLLPVKKDVRTKLGLTQGDEVDVLVQLRNV
jgi:hypothetical protein